MAGCSIPRSSPSPSSRRNAPTSEHAAEWRDAAAKLKASIEREAWDGDWYRRAYFDDGTPLGSVINTECRLDSIAQSWAVISRAAEPARAARAMEAVDKYLVRRDEKLSMLFTPPFDHPLRDPGYIKGYPPGIRENGGQYTHGSAWAALAFAMQGDGDKAAELLSMLNPINHARDQTGVHRYRVEPYVACADIYSMPPHVGRGGWTWYTGSAGWVYRTALEWLLGFRLQGDTLTLDPCISRGWPGFEITYRHRSSRYEISVENPLGVCRGILAVKLDGKMLEGSAKSLIPLADDGATHQVQIILGISLCPIPDRLKIATAVQHLRRTVPIVSFRCARSDLDRHRSRSAPAGAAQKFVPVPAKRPLSAILRIGLQMTARHQTRRAVCIREIGQRPHRIAHDGDVRLGERDHHVVGMDRLRGLAGDEIRQPGSRTPSTIGKTLLVAQQIIDANGLVTFEPVHRRLDVVIALQPIQRRV